MIIIQATELTKFVSHIFQAAGATAAGADLVANSLVFANLTGHDSHGVIRVPQYLTNISKGHLNPTAEPMIAHEVGAITMVDAQASFGQIGARFAAEISIEKAKVHGLAATGLYNCNHIGRVGEWVQLAANQNLIGLAYCNGGRPGGLVTPHGGAARRLGTNPLAAAVPVAGQAPILLDFATSVVAEGKVRVALNNERSIPEGWILDAQGEPSTAPQDLYDGGMLLPAATYKGYSLSLLAELLGGMLTGQGSPGLPGYTAMRNGVLFIVLSIDAFRPLEDFLLDSAALCQQLKQTPPAQDVEEVLLPGEPEQRAAAQRGAEGIPLDTTTWTELTVAATQLGVVAPL